MVIENCLADGQHGAQMCYGPCEVVVASLLRKPRALAQ